MLSSEWDVDELRSLVEGSRELGAKHLSEALGGIGVPDEILRELLPELGPDWTLCPRQAECDRLAPSRRPRDCHLRGEAAR